MDERKKSVSSVWSLIKYEEILVHAPSDLYSGIPRV
jgi:hypothetical protein